MLLFSLFTNHRLNADIIFDSENIKIEENGNMIFANVASIPSKI